MSTAGNTVDEEAKPLVALEIRNTNVLKFTSLVALTVQNAIGGLCMRHARTRPGPLAFSSTLVFMAEFTKLLASLALVYTETKGRWAKSLYNTVVNNPYDTLKVCIPSAFYIAQNNLLYLATSHLDAATFQVSYQLKILTTAMFAVLLMKRRLSVYQWCALVALMTGVAMVQISRSSDASSSDHHENRIIGFLASFGASLCSGFAGIYFEMILKGSDISVWMRNVQMSFFSLPFGLITCAVSEGNELRSKGFFYGYDLFIFILILIQAGGGLVVAMVVKYADNILKGFATSLAIIISCLASVYLFDFYVTYLFVVGAALVIFSIFLYGYKPSTLAVVPKPDNEAKLIEDI